MGEKKEEDFSTFDNLGNCKQDCNYWGYCKENKCFCKENFVGEYCETSISKVL